jgi:hypothetical protein
MPTDEAMKLRALNVEVLGPVADSGRFMNDCAVLALLVFIRGGVPLKASYGARQSCGGFA